MANNQRKSYFAERREQYMSATYFNKPANIEDIQNNVRRIIKDIKFNLITDDDMVLFLNDNVINTLIRVSFENYAKNTIVMEALYDFMGAQPARTYQVCNNSGIDINTITSFTGIEHAKYARRKNAWGYIYNTFMIIRNNQNIEAIKQIIPSIAAMDKSTILDL